MITIGALQMDMPSTRKVGTNKEKIACEYLQKQGLRLIKKNFRTRMGEIDLIMQDKKELIFIEVRFRQDQKYGSGADSIQYNKQKKILNTALQYLVQHKITDTALCRFDVISIDQKNKIEWIKQAFDAN